VLGADDLPLSGALVEVAGVPLASQTTGPGRHLRVHPARRWTPTRSAAAAARRRITVPQAADGYGYRAFDLADADWCETEIVLGESGAQVTLQGRNRAVYDWSFIDPEQGGPGTALAFTADDQTLAVTLPVPFPYYGQSFTELSVCGNGWLGLGATTATEYRGQAIPLAEAPNTVLAAFWEDLSPQQAVSGNVSTWHDAAGGRFIVEFSNIRQFSPTSDFETFQVILLDPAIHPTVSGDGAILFQYHTIGELDNATVGIENPAGTDRPAVLLRPGQRGEHRGRHTARQQHGTDSRHGPVVHHGHAGRRHPAGTGNGPEHLAAGQPGPVDLEPGVRGDPVPHRDPHRPGSALADPGHRRAAPGWQVSADTGVDLFRVIAID
jgi:hypothetical protein